MSHKKHSVFDRLAGCSDNSLPFSSWKRTKVDNEPTVRLPRKPRMAVVSGKTDDDIWNPTSTTVMGAGFPTIWSIYQFLIEWNNTNSYSISLNTLQNILDFSSNMPPAGIAGALVHHIRRARCSASLLYRMHFCPQGHQTLSYTRSGYLDITFSIFYSDLQRFQGFQEKVFLISDYLIFYKWRCQGSEVGSFPCKPCPLLLSHCLSWVPPYPSHVQSHLRNNCKTYT